jgi:hypothetical protein
LEHPAGTRARREGEPATVVKAARELVCGDCGDAFSISAHTLRMHRRAGTEPICHDCRHPRREPTPAEAARLRAWWLQRFTLDECREIAEAIWLPH